MAQVKLDKVKELVCMEQRSDVLAVGSIGHVTLLDPRRWGPLQCVASLCCKFGCGQTGFKAQQHQQLSRSSSNA